MKKRTRRKRNANHYFTSVHEQAIIDYAATRCKDKRTRLYIDLIQPAFNEMVDKIVFTYKFTNLPNIDYLRDECKIWLMTILDKYDQSKGSKAFSYFSVITKNWFIHKVKKQQKRKPQKDGGKNKKNTHKHSLLHYFYIIYPSLLCPVGWLFIARALSAREHASIHLKLPTRSMTRLWIAQTYMGAS